MTACCLLYSESPIKETLRGGHNNRNIIFSKGHTSLLRCNAQVQCSGAIPRHAWAGANAQVRRGGPPGARLVFVTCIVNESVPFDSNIL